MANSRSSSGFLWMFILLLAGGGAGYWWMQRDGGKVQLEFRTAAVTRGEVTQSVTASGQVTPLVTVQVGSQVSGLILRLHADFNSSVTNGQLLAELDPSSFQATVAQSEGDLANARASLNLATLNARRAKALLEQKLIADQEHDKTIADLELAEAAVKIRQARLLKDQLDLARATISSPIDGVVIQRNMDVGQTVAASFNAPVLFQIANDLRKMQIHAMVSEADIGGVEVGQDVSFTVDAFANRTFQGRVEQVRFSPTTNQNVVTYATVISVPNDDMKLRPGMTANVSIITSRARDVLRVSNAALRFRPPEGANVKSNTPPASPTAGATNVAASASPSSDGPTLEQLPENIRERVLSRYDKNGDGKLDAAETQAWKEGQARRAAGGGGGGSRGFGGSGGGGAGAAGPPLSRTVYKLETQTGPNGSKVEVLIPVELRLGITDGSYTEVKGGLDEKDVIVTGLVNPPPAAGSAGAPRQQNPFGGGGPPGGFRR